MKSSGFHGSVFDGDDLSSAKAGTRFAKGKHAATATKHIRAKANVRNIHPLPCERLPRPLRRPASTALRRFSAPHRIDELTREGNRVGLCAVTTAVRSWPNQNQNRSSRARRFAFFAIWLAIIARNGWKRIANATNSAS